MAARTRPAVRSRARRGGPAGVERPPRSAVCAVLERALAERRVVWVEYEDGAGELSRRCVEPVALVTAEGEWYLLAWCRLRDDARVFRLDRLRRALAADEPALVRELDTVAQAIPDVVLSAASFA